MTLRILHVTDASSSGVLAAVTSFARAQAAEPGTSVEFAYVPRADSPPLATIRSMVSPAVRVRRLARSHRGAVAILAARFPALLGRDRYDVIHVHSSRAGLLGRAAAVLTGNRARIVYSPHCFAFDRTDGSRVVTSVYRALERVGALLGPRLVLCSDSEQALARRTLPGARTAVLANSVDTAQLGAIARAASTTDASAGDGERAPLRIVHVGRITAQKRPAEFGRIAAAWPGLRAADPTLPAAEFVWLGEGDRSLLPPAVEVSGWLSPDALHERLAGADILLFTSAGEGMPIAVIEAQAMAIPVVGHAVTGVIDVVDDGRTGLLATSTDDLLTALVRVASDGDERARLGSAAAANARARFDLDDLAARSLHAYTTTGIDVSGDDS